MEGPTKNIFSRRDIKVTPVIQKALEAQMAIYEKFKGEYLFSDSNGRRILPASLRKQIWLPALKKANVQFREMKQTRHSFATIALSCGESPLWIAKTMGHRDTNMIIKVYGKYVENASGSKDGTMLNAVYQFATGK
jgi:integrase